MKLDKHELNNKLFLTIFYFKLQIIIKRHGSQGGVILDKGLTVIKEEVPHLIKNISHGLVPAELKAYVGPAMEEFRNEVAAELGLPEYSLMDKGELPSRLNGKVGGDMVGKMVAFTESVLAYYYKQRLMLKE